MYVPLSSWEYSMKCVSSVIWLHILQGLSAVHQLTGSLLQYSLLLRLKIPEFLEDITHWIFKEHFQDLLYPR